MSRTVFTVDLTTHSPLLIAERPGSFGETDRSLPYIPGTALRGALAMKMLAGRPLAQLNPTERDLFAALFLDGCVRFGTLLPGYESTPTVLPQSSWTCKAQPWPEPDNHGLVDLLAYLLPQLHGDPSMESLREVLCPHCQERLDRPTPRFARINYGRLEAVEPRRRLLSRTAVAPRRQTADPGLLYSIVTVDTGERFGGTIVVDDELADSAADLFKESHSLAIGGDRTRGLGRVEFQAERAVLAGGNGAVEDIGARLAAFNKHVRATAQREELPDVGATTFIPLTLASDTVFLDDYLLPAEPTAAVLSRYRELGGLRGTVPSELSLVLQLQSTGAAGGWDALLGLPRERLPGLGIGSVLVYSLPGEAGADTLRWLADLEREGLGERVAEGFGAVVVAHPLSGSMEDLIYD